MITIGRDHNGMLSGPCPLRAPISRGTRVCKRREYTTMDGDFSKIPDFCQENSAVLLGSSRPDAIYSLVHSEELFR
jgi:hypothetical protein